MDSKDDDLYYHEDIDEDDTVDDDYGDYLGKHDIHSCLDFMVM